MQEREVVVVGAGLAGLSAALYLGRAMRDVLVVDAGHSMAIWEPDVRNYLGFPDGISGEALLERGRDQAEEFGAEFVQDVVLDASGSAGAFVLKGGKDTYKARRVILATGITHLPPDVPGVQECMGHSLFFCKDCDGHRVRGKSITVMGSNDDAAEYALAMLVYSPRVLIATNGEMPRWDDQHAEWLKDYEVPVHTGRVESVEHEDRQIKGLCFEGGRVIATEILFTTRGDTYHNRLAHALGAPMDKEGQILVDDCMQTQVRGLYAAGCVTPANCQMIIAAGQGARAAQAVNRDLFEEDLATKRLRRYRKIQLQREETLPEIVE